MKFLFSFLLTFLTISCFSQVITVTDSVPHYLNFQKNNIRSEPQSIQYVYLIPAGIVRDTISNVEFTYIKNNQLKHGKGCLVQVSRLWMADSAVVQKTVEEFYIISDARMRYEIVDKKFRDILCNSKITEYNGLFNRLFRRKPEQVWEMIPVKNSK